MLQAVECQHVHRASQCCLRDVYRNRAVQIVLVPLEDGVFGDLEHYKQIAGRAAVGTRMAFLSETHLRAVIYAGGNVHFQLALAAVSLALFASRRMI